MSFLERVVLQNNAVVNIDSTLLSQKMLITTPLKNINL